MAKRYDASGYFQGGGIEGPASKKGKVIDGREDTTGILVTFCCLELVVVCSMKFCNLFLHHKIY